MISPRHTSSLILMVLIPILIWCLGQSRMVFPSPFIIQKAFTSFTLMSLSLVTIGFALLPDTSLKIQMRSLALHCMSLLTLPLPFVVLAVYAEAFSWMVPAKTMLTLVAVTFLLFLVALLKSALTTYPRLLLGCQLGTTVAALLLPIRYYEPWIVWVFANA